MPKKQYDRHYNKGWEKEPWAEGWLSQADANEENEAYCKVCTTSLRAHCSNLKKHAKTKQHTFKMASVDRVKGQSQLPGNFQLYGSNEDKNRDLKLAAYIAAHTSIRNVDHLCDILVDLGKGTSFEKFKLRRTKCSNLVKHVIAPSILEETIMDIKDVPYSLIVDESTDVSTIQYLCVMVKYFSKKKNQIATSFLGLLVLDGGTADALYDCLHGFLLENKMDLSNLIGLGTDGANSLCGMRHSLYTLLKKDCQNLILARCVCHSLNNASSKAAEKHPGHVDFMCHEIYNWFNKSPQRRDRYRKTFDLLNENHKKQFHNFVQINQTRWLCRYNAVNTILEHWFELKTHFDCVVYKNDEKCYFARQLNQMLNDNSNYLMLVAIRPVLYEVNQVNLLFQKNNVDAGKACQDLEDLFILLSRKIIKPSFMQTDTHTIIKALDNGLAYLPIEKADYGIDYYKALDSIKITHDARNVLELKTFEFFKSMCVELAKRLPMNLNIFKKIKFLSPNVCLSQSHPLFKDLPFLDLYVKDKDLGKVENQWNRLINVEWSKVNSGRGRDILESSYDLWPKVYAYENAGGVQIFRELAVFALTVLSLPSSNAIVERAFSIMNAVKTKSRNRLQMSLLDSLLRIRLHFYENNECCSNFRPSESMLSKFNYKELYLNKSTDKNEAEKLYEQEIETLDILDDLNIPCICIPE